MSYLDQIEKYLNGELTGEELKRFEERIKSNPRLAEDTQLYKDLKSFLSNNIDNVDQLIHSIDEVNQSIQQDEWNRPENARLVSTIGKIMMYLGDNIKHDVYQWLKTEAVLYPELFDDILHNINEDKFIKGKLSGEECLTLYDRLLHAYGSFTSINSVVDEFLHSKPMPEQAAEPQEKKNFPHTRVFHLPVSGAEKSEVRRPRFLIGRIAASIAILIAAGTLFLMIQSKQVSKDDLYADYNSTYAVSTVQRSANAAVSGDFYTGLEQYTSQQYTNAVASFSKVDRSNAYFIPACFFTGVSEMESGNYGTAITKFDEVIKSGGSNLAADAQWKLALCYLKMGNADQTQKILRQIIATNPFYEKKALDLLKKLSD